MSEHPDRPRIGISRCLLGEAVRYDGGHKRDALLLDAFGPHVEWIAVCPEVEVGMGTPREAIELVAEERSMPGGERRVRLLGVSTRRDWTDAMSRWSRARVRELRSLALDGYVLKSRSPSCGLRGIPVRGAGGLRTARTGRGLFAEALVAACPALPVEEETALDGADARATFIERVFAYSRLRALLRTRWSAGALVRFHTAHKLQLLSHSRRAYDSLGRLVADAGRTGRRELAASYARGFMDALAVPSTRGRHADVLTHALGHLKALVDEPARRELRHLVEEFRHGLVPLGVPLAVVRDHARRHGVEYLCAQTYLNPHPRELALRYHV